jgi:quercetin dioxygenase-like cupin family protein
MSGKIESAKIGIWEDAEPGVRRSILNANTGLMMMEVHFEKGAEGYVHSHVHEQMTYCLKGRLAFNVDGVETIISQGESIYLPSHSKHGVKALEEAALLDVFTPIRKDLLGIE